MLKLRLAAAAILIPLVLGSVYIGGLAFFAALALALLIAGWEFFDMTRRAGHRPQMIVGLGLIALIVFDTFAHTDPAFQAIFGVESWLRPVVTAALVITLVMGVLRHDKGWLTGWALTLAGALYIGWFGAYAILVRALPNGMGWVTIALLITWATDTGAYFVGTNFGKRGFFTQISPKKTWEGAIGGWLSAVIAALALGVFLDMPIIHRVLFGCGLGLVGTFGDLAESLLKRQTGVKDSSNIIPGHGGLLDRIDSLLFAAVFAYYYLIWIMRV